VTRENCNQCHVELQAHGGRRRSVVLCAMCHTAGAEDKNAPAASAARRGVTIDFRVMIHKLHNGAHLPSVLGVATNPDGSRNYAATPQPYQLVGFNNSVNDFSHVFYPVWPNLSSPMPKDQGYSALTSGQKTTEDTMRGGATACFKCHGDPDGDGPITDVPAQGDLHKTQPSRKACGSCHDDIDWDLPYKANGQTMPVIGATACNACHQASGSALDVYDAHVHPLENPAVDAGVVAEITDLSGGSGAGGRFLAGDVPTVQFTLKDSAGNDVGLPTMDSSSSVLVGADEPPPGRDAAAVAERHQPQPLRLLGAAGGHEHLEQGLDEQGRPGRRDGGRGPDRAVHVGDRLRRDRLGQRSPRQRHAARLAQHQSVGLLARRPRAGPSGRRAADHRGFSSPTAFSVTGSSSGAMGSGTLPNATSGSNRFTSTRRDGGLQRQRRQHGLRGGATRLPDGLRGLGANPVLFAIVAGKTSFSRAAPAPDRFYYEVVPRPRPTRSRCRWT
jgi:hypothetical protein